MVAYESECTFFSVWAQISLGDVVINVNYGQGKRNPGRVRLKRSNYHDSTTGLEFTAWI